MNRDPLVTPAVGDVVEGRLYKNTYRWTVESIDDEEALVRLVVTLEDGTVDHDGIQRVELGDWLDYSMYTDVRVASVARDPLVDPEPGDVVRAKDAATGERVVFVVGRASDGEVKGACVNADNGGASVFIYPLKHWRDWSMWIDVAVLS